MMLLENFLAMRLPLWSNSMIAVKVGRGLSGTRLQRLFDSLSGSIGTTLAGKYTLVPR